MDKQVIVGIMVRVGQAINIKAKDYRSKGSNNIITVKQVSNFVDRSNYSSSEVMAANIQNKVVQLRLTNKQFHPTARPQLH